MNKRAEKVSLERFPDINKDDCFDEEEYIDLQTRQVVDRILYKMAYNQAVEDVFNYLKKHYTLRNVDTTPMRWVQHDKVKQNFIDDE